jgi:hypothetical protein
MGSPLARTAGLGMAGLGASGAAAPLTAWAVLGVRPVAGRAAPSPGGSGSALGAQPARLGAGTARASGLLAGQRLSKVVGWVILVGCGGVVGLRSVVVGSVYGAGDGLLLSVNTPPGLCNLNMTVHVQIALRPCAAAVDPAPVGCLWRVPEAVRWMGSGRDHHAAGRGQDVPSTVIPVPGRPDTEHGGDGERSAAYGVAAAWCHPG